MLSWGFVFRQSDGSGPPAEAKKFDWKLNPSIGRSEMFAKLYNIAQAMIAERLILAKKDWSHPMGGFGGPFTDVKITAPGDDSWL